MNLTNNESPIAPSPGLLHRFGCKLSTIEIAILLLAVLAIAGLWQQTISRARDKEAYAIALTVKTNANLARSFEEHTVRTLNAVDQQLLLAKREYEQRGAAFDLPAFFELAMRDNELFLSAAITDERGEMVLGSVREARAVNISDREHFVVHRERDTGKPHVGQPVLARMANSWSIVVTRRINKADGSFGGVVGVAINPYYFTQLYEQVDLGKGSAIALIGKDGIVRARRADNNSEIGQNIRDSEVMRRHLIEPHGNFLTVSRVDGISRVFNYRTVKQYPLLVTVGVSQALVLAEAREDARHSRWIALIATILILLGALLLLKLTRRQARDARALRESEQRMRALLDGIPARVWLRDAAGRYIAMNRSEQQYLGRPADELLGKTVHDLLPPDKAEQHAASDAAVTAASGVLRVERHNPEDDTWQEVIKAPILNNRGALAGLVGISTDITPRKRSEMELAGAKSAFENAVEGIARLNSAGRYTTVNAAYAACAGFEAHELIGRPWQPTVHPDDVPLVEAAYGCMVESGKGETEVRGIRKDGTIYYKSVVLVRAAASESEPGGFYCFIKDVSERMRTAAALRDSEQRLRALLDGIPDRVWFKDLEGRFVAVNRAYEKGSNMQASQMIGKTLAEVSSDPQIPQKLDEDRRVIETRMPIRFETCSPFSGNTWQDVIKAPILNAQGEVIGTVGIARDITERMSLFEEYKKAKATAESANQAKSEFLAAMSHDIRTPMTGVLGVVDLLAETPLSAEQRQYLDTLRTSGESMIEIIDSVLSFSKVEAGKLEVHPAVFAPAALVRQAAELFRARAAANGTAIQCDIDAPAHCRVIGDQVLIGRSLTNLVSNAVKFTERGQIDIGLSVRPAANGKATLRFEVRDTGIGISKPDLDRLFSPFTQVDLSATWRNVGSGLGLALSKSMVELMDGSMDAESVLGKGSCFSFTLNLPQVQHDGDVSLDTVITRMAKPAPSKLQGCVVLAEDHPVNRKVISGLLKKFGLEVRGAANGGEALAQWRAGGVDLIVMDCHMPGMDGYAATELIRSEEKDGEHQGQHVPIIALTANASVGDALACIEAGMDGYATKPVMNSRLAWLLGRYLSREGAVKVPVRLPLFDAGSAASAPAGAALERFVRAAEAQTTILRDQLQAGQVAAAAASAGHLQTFSSEVGAMLLAALYGELQQMADSGAVDDARASLLELDGVLQATLKLLRNQVPKAAA